ncbi:MAG TPA: helix-turn-helix domain-containing protein [Anaerovoracaceae bacterium]|nr:helix-turn-helix domain-containing protein [Anaerovoracaceae bacterium]
MKNFIIPNLTKVDPVKLSEYLIESVRSFSDITGIPVTYFNRDGEIVSEYKKEEKICNLFKIYEDPKGSCRVSISSAGQFASRLGEPYIFICRVGFTNIATSLIVDGQYIGYFIAGPIIMGELRESTSAKISDLNDLDDSTLALVKMFASKMTVYEPNQVSQLALLFYNSVITSINGNSDYSALRNQYKDQAQINTNIRRYKKMHQDMDYPYDLEKTLIGHITDGQTEAAKKCIAELIDRISTLESGELAAIKAKVLWLFAIIIRLATEKHASLRETLDADSEVIIKLSEADSYKSLKAMSINLVETITSNMITSVYSGSSSIIAKALQYINRNYKDKITLTDIENNLNVNGSYFSSLFRHEMGITFTEYLNQVKIDYACQLLETTNLSIIDISLATGYEDQSYFTKVFKKCTGETPKQHRNKAANQIEQ